MDEILIDEKRYVSSKRAAKLTGYAKDYIGQLCREGRVPARLVGRSWYVLESAIQDHRFKTDETEKEKESVQDDARRDVSLEHDFLSNTHYESSVDEEIKLPSVNKLRSVEEEILTEPENDVTTEHINDTWKSWFERVADNASHSREVEKEVETIAARDPEVAEAQTDKTVAVREEETKGTNVPLHALYRQPPEELLPVRTFEYKEAESPAMDEATGEASRPSGVRTLLKIGSVVTASLFVVLALAGTGILDRYIISYSQVGIIAGISFYDK